MTPAWVIQTLRTVSQVIRWRGSIFGREEKAGLSAALDPEEVHKEFG